MKTKKALAVAYGVGALATYTDILEKTKGLSLIEEDAKKNYGGIYSDKFIKNSVRGIVMSISLMWPLFKLLSLSIAYAKLSGKNAAEKKDKDIVSDGGEYSKSEEDFNDAEES